MHDPKFVTDSTMAKADALELAARLHAEGLELRGILAGMVTAAAELVGNAYGRGIVGPWLIELGSNFNADEASKQPRDLQ